MARRGPYGPRRACAVPTGWSRALPRHGTQGYRTIRHTLKALPYRSHNGGKIPLPARQEATRRALHARPAGYGGSRERFRETTMSDKRERVRLTSLAACAG
ncbi:MAG: hypothetical protein OHK0015_37970 [Chloroflexi bacterium OHK40]